MSVSREALEKAIKHAGSASSLARKAGVGPQNIFNWLARGVPACRVPSVVQAVDGAVQAHELRPDLPQLFPPPAATARVEIKAA